LMSVGRASVPGAHCYGFSFLVSIFIALVWPPGHEPFSLKMLVNVGG